MVRLLPSFAGEVAPSYGDGGVMSIITVAHDPSARFAGTSPRFAQEGNAFDQPTTRPIVRAV
jgi:hypothetical protein